MIVFYIKAICDLMGRFVVSGPHDDEGGWFSSNVKLALIGVGLLYVLVVLAFLVRQHFVGDVGNILLWMIFPPAIIAFVVWTYRIFW